jgi:hypothetical protein
MFFFLLLALLRTGFGMPAGETPSSFMPFPVLPDEEKIVFPGRNNQESPRLGKQGEVTAHDAVSEISIDPMYQYIY